MLISTPPAATLCRRSLPALAGRGGLTVQQGDGDIRRTTTLALVTLALAPTASGAVRDAPGWWLASSGWQCIHRYESVDWRWGPNHHPGQTNWNGYFGGFQFTLSTWQSTFAPDEPHGLTYARPELASPAEQRYRAFVNWTRNGRRWGGGQWPTSSRRCGLA